MPAPQSPHALVLAAVAACMLLIVMPAQARADAGIRITEVDETSYPIVRVGLALQDARSDLPPITLFEGGQAADSVSVVPGRIGVVEPDARLAVTLAVDTSDSMRGAKLAAARAAAERLLTQLRDGDRVGLVTFDGAARTLVPPTTDVERIRTALEGLRETSYGTALFDGVTVAAESLPADVDRRVVLVLSDGADVGSEHTLADVTEALDEQGAQTFTVGIRGGSFDAEPLEAIASASGGTFYAVADAGELPDLYQQLGASLVRPYWLEYRSSRPSREPFRLVLETPAGRADAVLVRPPALDARAGGGATTAPAASPPDALIQLPDASWAAALVGVPFGAALAVLLLHVRGTRRRSRVARRLTAFDRLREDAERGAHQATRTAMRRQIDVASQRALGGTGAYRHVEHLLERAGVPWRVSELIGASAGLAAAALLFGMGVSGLALGLVLSALSAPLPYVVARLRARRRLRALERQLPGALNAIAASLRAGHSLEQAMRAVSADLAAPLGVELERVLAEARLGRSLEHALAGAAKRIASRDFDFVVTTVAIQRQVGGSMAHITDMVAETVRNRQLLRSKLRALTATGRLSAYVLVGLPIFLALVVTAMNPEFMAPLYTTTAGHALIVIGVVSILLGGLLINRVVSIRA